MADGTHIEWANATFNPWVGCTKVSAACDHCYAESWAKRTGHPELWTGERRRTTASYWQQPIKWDRQAQTAGIRKRVFCASLADVFDNQVPTRWRDDLWFLIDEHILWWQRQMTSADAWAALRLRRRRYRHRCASGSRARSTLHGQAAGLKARLTRRVPRA